MTVRTIPKPSREAVAHHEAGHAVMAVAIYGEIKDATIVPTPDALGRVRRAFVLGNLESYARDIESGDAGRRWWGRGACLNEARFAVAGFIAEGIYTGSHWWRPWSESILPESSNGDVGDVGDVAVFVRALEIAARGTLAFLGYQNRLGREVRAYLTANWRAVEDVAALLLREGTVDGEAVGDVVYEAVDRHGLDLFAESVTTPWWKMPRSLARPAREAA